MAGKGFFEKFNDELMGEISKLADVYQTQLATDIMTLASVSITLYVLWKGYQVLAGKTQTPVQDLIYELAKFAIIIMFISNTDGLLNLLVEGIKGIREGFGGGENIWSNLDTLWQSSQKLSQTIFNKDTSKYVPMSGAIASLFAWLGSVILMIASSIVYITADLSLTLLIVTAPVFIFCLMFGFLRPMFNNWLQSIFSSVLVVLFSTMIIKFIISHFETTTTAMLATTTEANLVTVGMMTFVIGSLGAILLTISTKFAFSLAGAGVDATMQGATMAGIGSGLSIGSKAVKTGSKASFGVGRGIKDSKRTGDDIKGLNERASFSTKAGYVAGHALGKAGSKMGDLRKSILERKRAGG